MYICVWCMESERCAVFFKKPAPLNTFWTSCCRALSIKYKMLVLLSSPKNAFAMYTSITSMFFHLASGNLA